LHHPDKGGNPDKFQKISHAFKIISNEKCRVLYDEFGMRALDIINLMLNSETDVNSGDTGEFSLDNIDNINNLDLDLVRFLIETRQT